MIGTLKHRLFLACKSASHLWRSAAAGDRQKQVVFVAGVQRSGTNMLMDVLESSFETDVFHERDPRAFADYQMRPSPVIRQLVEASRAPRVVIKALCESQELGDLMRRFAPAKALWMVRRYEDMVNSHLRSWRGCPETVGRIAQDKEGGGWRGRGMSDATHEIVRAHYHPGIDDASAVALFWYFRNVLFFELGLDRNENVLPLSYESFVTRPAEEIRSICEFLDLSYLPRFSRHVVTTSIGKHSPPAIDPDIRALCDSLCARFEVAGCTVGGTATGSHGAVLEAFPRRGAA